MTTSSGMENSSKWPNLDSSDDEDVGNEGARSLGEQLRREDSDSALSEDDNEVAAAAVTGKESRSPSRKPSLALPPAVEGALKKLPPR